jgi:hypothetical protein
MKFHGGVSIRPGRLVAVILSAPSATAFAMCASTIDDDAR